MTYRAACLTTVNRTQPDTDIARVRPMPSMAPAIHSTVVRIEKGVDRYCPHAFDPIHPIYQTGIQIRTHHLRMALAQRGVLRCTRPAEVPRRGAFRHFKKFERFILII
ncbi:hypothetical protein [Burkholderia sp. Nafp2/4-1b]|uniref:hypothetical protein n=1 Tax=Burkholderia sp. Nafp2/4-1b TaxID=2116686 RepID=UPI0013CF2FEA|nr:hypothetical protein [Burkholderia sp. Nafp2/4-1b]